MPLLRGYIGGACVGEVHQGMHEALPDACELPPEATQEPERTMRPDMDDRPRDGVNCRGHGLCTQRRYHCVRIDRAKLRWGGRVGAWNIGRHRFGVVKARSPRGWR